MPKLCPNWSQSSFLGGLNLARGLVQVAFVHDVVTVEDGAGLVPAYGHRNLFGYTIAHHVAHS